MSGIDRTQSRPWSGRRWLTGLLVLAALVMLTEGVQAREVVVGLYDNDPKVFRDASGQPAGIFVDLVERLAEEEGWELSWVDCRWSECVERTAAGEIDLMPDVAITEDRREILSFHELPALHSWSQVYRDPGIDIDSVLDLRDRRVALLEESIQFSRVDELLHDFGMGYEPVLVPDIRSAFAAVAEGRADVAVVNHLFGSRYYRDFGLARTPVMLEPAELFFATARGRNADLLEAIDRHLAAWRENGDSVYYDVLERWMGERPAFYLPGWLPWVASISAGLLLLAIAIAVWLRHQVGVRTRRLDETSGALEIAYQVIDASPVVLFRWRPEPGWPVAYVSDNIRRWGYEAEQWIEEGRHFADIIHPDDLPRLDADRESQLESGADGYRQEYRIHRPEDGYFWVEGLSRLIRDDEGRVHHIEGVVTDITERRESERSQREAAAVIENTLEGVIITDARERIIRVNRAFCALTGHDESEVLGRPVTLLDAEPDGNPWAEIRRQLANDGHWQGEMTSRRKNGEAFPELRTINRVDGLVGEGDRVVHMFTDMSRIKATEEQLDFLSLHDPLTGLPNRSLLLSHLRDRIAAPGRRRMGLLMIDLDRFRDVNDSYGHDVGDDLLRQVAGRLDELLGGAFLARLGGDEFAVLSEDFDSEIELARLAEALIGTLSDPWQLGGDTEVRLGASVGITLYPTFGRSPEELLQQADAALYRAKAEGRGDFRFFDESLTASARQRIEMETRLRRGIENDDLELRYQPQLDVQTGEIIGAEALVRWRDGERGLVSPAEFIPVAEQTGMIGALGDWVLREACRQGRAWLDAGLLPGRLAVNLSAWQLRDAELVDRIALILEETGFPADRLELELTESALMRQQDKVVTRLRQLKALGVHLAIDDFGTGYSSLAYLQQFPIDVLKIDKRFVDNLAENHDDREIASAILAMGHALGLSVIAEGVEVDAQLAFLRENGCDAYQGYIVSPPVPADEFATLLDRNRAPRDGEG